MSATHTLSQAPLSIGPLELDVPVVLAPMAGITNTAFRRLCREFGAGLYVSEMITSRALVERTPESMRLITHHESETTRSIQLYGVDPKTVSEAVTMLVAEDRADHIDLNFGCPVPKVTRKGGGAALPWKRDLFRQIVEGAVRAAGDIPLTVKMRKGIDSDHLTYIEAAKAAQGAGAASIALHARTAAEFYSGQADWSAIAKLKDTITDTPVLGNGDIWSAADALRMVRETGCDGVVVGRGCLGRPWLFGDLAAAFRGETQTAHPSLGTVAQTFRRHAELLTEFFGDEDRGCRDIRKHVA
ncbi:MAG: tRNA dihydrouridine synthase DusB, partial [Leifsonia sp.]